MNDREEMAARAAAIDAQELHALTSRGVKLAVTDAPRNPIVDFFRGLFGYSTSYEDEARAKVDRLLAHAREQEALRQEDARRRTRVLLDSLRKQQQRVERRHWRYRGLS